MRVQTINEDFEIRNKKRKKNQKKIKRMVFIIKLILTVGLISATAILLALSPLFNISRIEVKGAVHYSDVSLISISGAVKGVNGFKQTGSSPGSILGLRLGNAEKLILQRCPYVKAVSVRFVLPDSIVINVTERIAAAAIPRGGTSFLIDSEGYVLEEAPLNQTINLPSVNGLKLGDCKPGMKPAYENGEALGKAFDLLDEVRKLDRNEPDKLYPKIDSLDVSDPGSMVLSLEKRVKVRLDDMEDLNYRLSVVKTIFFRNIKKEDRGTLDFTSGENPVFTPESGG